MFLELHIFGPAFGLPSIDPECLATIIYLRKCQGGHNTSNGNVTWHLVASNDLNVSPFRKLPALRIRDGDGQDQEQDIWVAGFENITTYLRGLRRGDAFDLDGQLDEVQRAENYALQSFIRSRGGPILDLSLYVSSENYNSCTRPALGKLLHWPESWTLPHKLREDARQRSEHLGLSALDVDTVTKQQGRAESGGLAAHIPKSLRKPRQTIGGILSKSAQQTKFRLEGVTEGFLEPLANRLQSTDTDSNLVGNDFHSVDCLAVAFLTLMQQPKLPQAWLAQMLEKRYPTLSRWARGHSEELLEPAITMTTPVIGQMQSSNTLPWITAPERTISQTSLAALETLVRTIPGLRSIYDSVEMPPRSGGRKRSPKDQQLAYIAVRKRQLLYSQVIASSVAATSVVGWLIHAGIFTLSRKDSTSRRRNFGEAGSLLGLL